MARLFVVISSVLLAIGPIASVVEAAPDAAYADDVAIPAADLMREIEAARFDLEFIRRDLSDGFLPGATPDEFAAIDALLDRLDDFEARAGSVTFAEVDEFYDDLDAVVEPIFERAGLEPLPFDDVTDAIETDPDSNPSAAPPVRPVATVAADIEPVDDGPETRALARRAAALVFDEARLILALDAFDSDTTELERLVAAVSGEIDADRQTLSALLRSVDARAAEPYPTLTALTPPISPATRQTVAPLLESDFASIASGGTAPLPAQLYVDAIEALLARSGRPVPTGSQATAFDDIIRALNTEWTMLDSTIEAPDSAVEAPADDEGAAEAAPQESAEPAPSNDASSSMLIWILLGIGAAVALAASVRIFLGRRRSRSTAPVERSGFNDLLDVSRRLAAAGSAEAVERLAVQQAIRLTGAAAGAFVRHADRRLTAGYVSDDGLLVGDRLADGILDQVVSAGQEMMQVSQTEPAIRNLPVSLIAAPVFASGAIVGALLVVRDANKPFSIHDLGLLGDLKPMVGAAIESAQHADRAQAEALADALTGIKNRRALDLHIGGQGPDAPFAAVMVDFDHFKSVNDTFGHQAGDDLLRAAAQRLTANVRPGDEVYRYGGEEFAIIMPDTDERTAADIAERVRSAIAGSPFTIGPDQVSHSATASLGVAAGNEGAAVIGRADAALYAAKAAGRDRVTCAGVPA